MSVIIRCHNELFAIIVTSTVFDTSIAISRENALANEEQNNFENISLACNNFASPLYKRLAYISAEMNIVISPLNVYIMLSLLFNGAEGSTLDELKSVLHFKDEISFNNELKALIILLSDIKNNELQITNTAYVQEGIEIMDDFLTIYTHTYSNNFISFLSYIDFEYIDNAQYINYAIQVITNNKISDVILPEYINDDTKFVLVNTVYFKPRWLDIFDEKDTKEHMFHVSKTQKYFVPTMFKNSIYKYGIIESWRCSFIEIPYLIGLNMMFEDQANFKRLSKSPLKVNRVLQKVIVEVNEKASEFPAAKVVNVKQTSKRNKPNKRLGRSWGFIVNRPFMFAIEHKRTRMPLFVGSVRIPNISRFARVTSNDEL